MFMMLYESGLGFESASAETNGPFTLLKTKDYAEYYNLRYGATSRVNSINEPLQSITESTERIAPIIVLQILVFAVVQVFAVLLIFKARRVR